MGEVLDLEAYRPVWIPGIAICKGCGKRHVGVFHKDAIKDTECPHCGGMKADLIND